MNNKLLEKNKLVTYTLINSKGDIICNKEFPVLLDNGKQVVIDHDMGGLTVLSKPTYTDSFSTVMESVCTTADVTGGVLLSVYTMLGGKHALKILNKHRGDLK